MEVYNLSSVIVLVIDDNRHMLRLARTMLSALGVLNIHEARDGAEGLEAMTNVQPDIILLDWVMDGMDGIEFTRQVRQSDNPEINQLPIVMMTSHTQRSRVEIARDAGITEFLAKPISAHALYQRIAAVIERPREFIMAEDFIGPDRRRHSDADYDGPDRRGGGDG